MSLAVLADAQFGVPKVLKPYPGFEADYQGESGNKPIAIPGILDADAGKAGFDQFLLAGSPVPFGSKLMIWIPTLRGTAQGTVQNYRYQVIFRLRNIRDFKENKVAYHFPKSSPGENGEFIVPACQQTIIYEGPEPTSSGVSSTSDAKHKATSETYSFTSIVGSAPYAPGSGKQDAAYQQGLGNNQDVTFNDIQMDCEGDEIIILVTKGSSSWNFATGGSDDGFARFFGNQAGAGKPISAAGIYVFSGSNP